MVRAIIAAVFIALIVLAGIQIIDANVSDAENGTLNNSQASNVSDLYAGGMNVMAGVIIALSAFGVIAAVRVLGGV